MSALPRSAVRVRVPATSANLGPGFDALGLALALHDEVEVRVLARPGVRVHVEGEGAGEVPSDEAHLVARAVREVLPESLAPGLELRCLNAVPHGKGLGSSAAAAVAGALAGAALRGGPGGDDGRRAVLEAACRLEGHADNAAAALLGGATAAWHDEGSGRVRAAALVVGAHVEPVVLVPAEVLPTHRARAMLPPSVPHADAAHAAGRAALLVEALARRPDLLLPATEDRLHQAARAGAMPATARLVAELRGRGVPAVVSGAGPTVLALAGDVDAGLVPAGWRALRPGVDRSGAVVEVLG